jgi:hypothetical protein
LNAFAAASSQKSDPLPYLMVRVIRSERLKLILITLGRHCQQLTTWARRLSVASEIGAAYNGGFGLRD